ncbi:MAG: hypothetical protein AVDCRST_MAG49-1954, partial [uncultured Thermomicrobiales bacterium]
GSAGHHSLSVASAGPPSLLRRQLVQRDDPALVAAAEPAPVDLNPAQPVPTLDRL